MRLPPLLALALSLSLATACRGSGSAPPRTTAAPLAVPEVPVLTRFEVTYDVPGRTRHHDDVAVDARFIAPSGEEVHVGGFPSHGHFATRFTPREAGLHTFEVRADGGTGAEVVSRGRFMATASRQHGFVRVDANAKTHHRLVHDDGTPLHVLGENRINIYDPTWNFGGVGTAAYLARMASYGMTTVRVFLFADCESESAGGYQIGCLENGVGRFDDRTADAIDLLFDAAHNNGIHVILVANAVGFTPGDETWKSWADNPYSAERGGPAASVTDYFSAPALRSHAIRKLRYIADRWGSSTQLLAIDLLNEPEWDGRIPETIWVPWAQAMSDAWRSFDPYRHLVTAGPVGLHWNVEGDERPWYASAKNDIVQWHLYGKEFYDPHALGAEMTRKVDETWGFGKPVLCGEFGYGGEDKTTYDHTHVGIWSLLFSGAGALAHTAPPFEVDSDAPMTPQRGAHFRVLSSFLRGLDAHGAEKERALSPRRDVRISAAGARVWSLASDDATVRGFWVLGSKDGYGAAAPGATVTFPSPPARHYRVRWIDDVTAATLLEATVDAPGKGELTLPVPSFVRHTAGSLTAVE